MFAVLHAEGGESSMLDFGSGKALRAMKLSSPKEELFSAECYSHDASSARDTNLTAVQG
jgi:hypothetical protein